MPASDLLTMPRERWRDCSVIPSHRDPDMLYKVNDQGAKTCRLCGEQYARLSRSYHSHAAKHMRDGLVTVVRTPRYRRWYQLTGPGLIHAADRED